MGGGVQQRERWAVSALFLINGALFASVLPRLPEVKASLEVTDGQLGLALLGVGLGGITASLSTRWLLPRIGSRRLGVGGLLAMCAAVPFIGLAPSRGVLFFVLIGVGAADALTDVSMNVSGVEAQRRLGRSVLNSMHAVWSIGAVTAGALASVAAALAVPLTLHLTVVAVAGAGLALLVRASVPDATGAGSGRQDGRRRLSPLLALVCVVAVLAAFLEDSPASWSAIYLSDHTGAGPGVAGLGFTAFMTAMVVGRLFGDRAINRFGIVAVVRTGATAAGLALAAALLVGGTAPALVAFAVVGLGAATVFPAMITAAGTLPGQGVAAANVAARLGFLAAPAVVGLVADGVGLPASLGLLVVPAALGIALAAGSLRPRSEGQPPGETGHA